MKRLLVLSLALTGCIHVSKSVLVDRSDQPVPKENVQVFFGDEEVPESCERVALLQAAASEDFTDQQELADKFRKEAGKLGANAVYVQEAYGRSGAGSSVFDSGADTEFDAEAYWCPDGPGAASGAER